MSVELTLDMSDLKTKAMTLRANLSEKSANNVLKWVTVNTARRVRPILKKQIPQDYGVKQNQVGETVKQHTTSGTNATIPVVGPRLSIGGKHIKAWGSKPGWASLRGKPYSVYGGIYAGKRSKLPTVMDGKNKPFRNSKMAKNQQIAFYRERKGRLPIIPVKTVSIPQMPLNKSNEAVVEKIHEEMSRQLDLYITRMIK